MTDTPPVKTAAAAPVAVAPVAVVKPPIVPAPTPTPVPPPTDAQLMLAQAKLMNGLLKQILGTIETMVNCYQERADSSPNAPVQAVKPRVWK